MLAKVSLIDWPFPSDNSEVPDFADYEARDRYVARFINSSLVFEDVAFDGRVNTSIRLELATTWLEEVCGCWTLGAMNYCKVEFFDKSENIQGCRFYFIDGIDILNSYYAGDAVGTIGNSVVSLNIRADPWMNSMLPLRDITGQAGICRPCIVEQAHVDRWKDKGNGWFAAKLYPIKEGCDGWRHVSARRDITGLADGSDDYISPTFGVVIYTVTNDTRTHIFISPIGLTLTGGHSPPSQTDFLDGSVINAMGLQSSAVQGMTLFRFFPLVAERQADATYKIYKITDPTHSGPFLRPEVLQEITPINVGSVYGFNITSRNDIWASFFRFYDPVASNLVVHTIKDIQPVAAASLPIAANPDTYEPAKNMEPARQLFVCNATGEAIMKVPDTYKQYLDIILAPIVSANGVSVMIAMSEDSANSNHMYWSLFRKSDICGARSIMDSPAIDIISSQWLDYSLSQRSLDNAYKKQVAMIDGVTNMANSTANGLIAGNPTGALAGLTSGVISGVAEQEKYKLGVAYNDATIRNKPNTLAVAGEGKSIASYSNECLALIETELDEVSMNELLGRFNLYGYNLNMLMVPDWTNRRYFNYIQTRNINLSALVPRQRDIRDRLETVFNRGVRVWHMDRVEADGMHYSSFDFTKENIEQALIS